MRSMEEREKTKQNKTKLDNNKRPACPRGKIDSKIFFFFKKKKMALVLQEFLKPTLRIQLSGYNNRLVKKKKDKVLPAVANL